MLMGDGRPTQVVLIDDRILDFIVQPRLLGGELLDLVASHVSIKEKEYFGLSYKTDVNDIYWLSHDRKVLDHDFLSKTGTLVFHFSVRFYLKSINQLQDVNAVEAFVLNARKLIFKGDLNCDSETAFDLAAHILQATYSDYESDEKTRDDLKNLHVIPTQTLSEHPSLAYCEQRVIHHYRALAGTERGLALVNYMTIVESLPAYGIHYFEVKDKKDLPWWLGIGFKGISVYDKNDKETPRRIFNWRQLENLYYRDRKFSIEVYDPKRGSASKRPFASNTVNVHDWLAASPQLTKNIWSMAVDQHQFYVERKHSPSRLSTSRSMSELAAELSYSTASLASSNTSDAGLSSFRSASMHSLPSLSVSKSELSSLDREAYQAKRDMYETLKAKKQVLEETLKLKLEELKFLCIKEGDLCGQLPPETPLNPGEDLPLVRKRMGTAFTLSPSIMQRTESIDGELSQLELEYDLQSKITSAALKLSRDKTVHKKLRKKRLEEYKKAQIKLKETGQKLVIKRQELERMKENNPKISDMIVKSQSGVLSNDSGMYSESSPVPFDDHYRSYSKHIKNLLSSADVNEAAVPQAFVTTLPPRHESITSNSPRIIHNSYRQNGVSRSSPDSDTQKYRVGRPRGSPQETDLDSIILKSGSRFGSEGSIYDKNSARNSYANRHQHSDINDSVFESPANHMSRTTSLHNQSYQEANKPSTPAYSRFYSSRSRNPYEAYCGSLDRLKQKWNADREQLDDVSRCPETYDISLVSPQQSERSEEWLVKSPITTKLSDLRVTPVGSGGNVSSYGNRNLQSQQPSWYLPSEQRSPRRCLDYNSPVPPSHCDSSHTAASNRSLNDDPQYMASYRSINNDYLHTAASNRSLKSQSQSSYTHFTYSPRQVEGISHYEISRRNNHDPPSRGQSSNHLVFKRESPAHPARLGDGQTSAPSYSPPYSPSAEMSKPYELADYYKYSERIRRRRVIDNYHQSLIGGSLNTSFDGDHAGSPGPHYRNWANVSTRSSPVNPSWKRNDSSSRPPPGPHHGLVHSRSAQNFNNIDGSFHGDPNPRSYRLPHTHSSTSLSNLNPYSPYSVSNSDELFQRQSLSTSQQQQQQLHYASPSNDTVYDTQYRIALEYKVNRDICDTVHNISGEETLVWIELGPGKQIQTKQIYD